MKIRAPRVLEQFVKYRRACLTGADYCDSILMDYHNSLPVSCADVREEIAPSAAEYDGEKCAEKSAEARTTGAAGSGALDE